MINVEKWTLQAKKIFFFFLRPLFFNLWYYYLMNNLIICLSPLKPAQLIHVL